ncbi:MAG: hypothetical protein EXQ96_07370 [Alphaproteobacteria bacterium]|nr:hypothetical protein [Alphaproteobacteria bacterium]
MSTRVIVAALAATLAAAALPAAVAPQILGVVATAEPIPLTCERGTCTAELTSFCLQRGRASPTRGEAYLPVDAGHLRLTATLANGGTRAVPVTGNLTLASERSHTAVRVSVPESVLRSLGAMFAIIEITTATSFVPVPVAGDPQPITPAELALVSDAHRSIAVGIVDRGGDWMQAATVANAMINVLPAGGSEDEAVRNTAWASAERLAALIGASDGAMLMAKGAFDWCKRQASGTFPSFRGCLGSMHDRFVGPLNNRFWQAVEPSS